MAENFQVLAMERRFESSAYARKFLEEQLSKTKARLEASERELVAYGAALAKGYMVRVDGRTWTLEAPAARRGGGAAGGDGVVRAPMTGTVLEVACKPGDVVEARQTLVVVSAMKMEHKLTAGVAGVVRKVTAQKGGTVDQGAELVVVEPQKVEPNKAEEKKS
jgi:biotin carboxyl carrier protein